ncbi:hypothetical protein QR685DRAFT_440318, partial [Neurospora intermedia]
FNNSLYIILGIIPNKVVYKFKPQSILDILTRLFNKEIPLSIVALSYYNTKDTLISFKIRNTIYIQFILKLSLYYIIRKVKYSAYKFDFPKDLKF